MTEKKCRGAPGTHKQLSSPAHLIYFLQLLLFHCVIATPVFPLPFWSFQVSRASFFLIYLLHSDPPAFCFTSKQTEYTVPPQSNPAE